MNALRSGDFKQGKGTLCDVLSLRYCCLGVLCELNDELYTEPNMHAYSKGTNWAGNLSDEFRERIGLRIIEEERLIKMNDGKASFETIADYIEDEL